MEETPLELYERYAKEYGRRAVLCHIEAHTCIANIVVEGWMQNLRGVYHHAPSIAIQKRIMKCLEQINPEVDFFQVPKQAPLIAPVLNKEEIVIQSLKKKSKPKRQREVSPRRQKQIEDHNAIIRMNEVELERIFEKLRMKNSLLQGEET